MILEADPSRSQPDPADHVGKDSVSSQPSQSQVARILQSKAFRTSEVHRNLLKYLAEKSLAGEGDSLKEYTVGLDVFAKPDSFDPRSESVVRMHMARLRQKLGEYYRTEGVDDPLIVDLPKGGFRVTFEPKVVPVEPEPAVTIAPASSERSFRRKLVIMAAALVVAISLATYFGLRLTQVETQKDAVGKTTTFPTTWTPELRELWAPLISSDRPLVVVLATQPGANVSGNAGTPQTQPNLTSLTTANGAFLLGQFLADRKQSVYLTGSDALSMPEISMGNVVFLGPMASSRQLTALPVKEAFTLESKGVRNIHPLAGEPEFFEDGPHKRGGQSENGVEESYGLVTHAPSVHRKGDVLYLSGNHVASVTAGVESFTDPMLAGAIVGHLRKPDGTLPRYYQIVLKIKSMDDTPVEVSYVLHKELMAH
jgi:hypothetical protein